ncbi:hypothetical protein WH95_19495 [Kiloniella litopenaei]|uniref:DUF2274 domain-containing protein n=1 Tax=Kiloniella litopenaei TaxID=1549748 RepID=A0A0M2R003_9PROT|nr:DUF2274 domain-containing protein [Kiloniella litopenaei]KKJ75207.1 hypothetical protein WH95_19495 [Kiloniella litopenaei]
MSVSLKKIEKDTKTVIKKLEIKTSVFNDIELYVQGYNEQYNDNISIEELIPELLEDYLAKDRNFQSFKKNQGGSV